MKKINGIGDCFSSSIINIYHPPTIYQGSQVYQASLVFLCGLDFFASNCIFIEKTDMFSHIGIRLFRYSEIGILHTLLTKMPRSGQSAVGGVLHK